MKRPVLITAMTLAAAGLLGFGQPATPPGHPTVGGNQDQQDAPEPPPAAPADVESLDAIINTYYAAISGAKGEVRNWDRFRSLFPPAAQLIAARPVGENNSGLWALSVEDFIGFNANYFEKGGYFEREVARRVETFGNIAQVWSTYEARHHDSEPEAYLRGIYSFQLLKDGDRWWIVNAYWEYERPDNPIPEKYLQNDS